MGARGTWRAVYFKRVLKTFAGAYAKNSSTTLKEVVLFCRLQQLIGIDVDGNCDVFGEGQFVEGFAHETAQMHDSFAAEQDVEAELAL